MMYVMSWTYLLLQVVFQAQMYSEQGAFNFQDVVQAICDKLIRRHHACVSGRTVCTA